MTLPNLEPTGIKVRARKGSKIDMYDLGDLNKDDLTEVLALKTINEIRRYVHTLAKLARDHAERIDDLMLDNKCLKAELLTLKKTEKA